MKATVQPVKDLEEINDKLLDLIEQGDPTVILSPEHTFSLNELFKHELISINHEKLELTEKGRKAKELGVRSFLEQEEIPEQEEILITKKETGYEALTYRPFLTILLFVLIVLLSISIWIGST